MELSIFQASSKLQPCLLKQPKTETKFKRQKLFIKMQSISLFFDITKFVDSQ